MKTVCTVLVVLALATPAAAQTAANPLTSATKTAFDIVKGFITKAAEKVPEDQYSFKPSPDVRTFGQLIGHIADANHMICGAAGGTGKPGDSIEKTKTSKADLQKALADSFAACDARLRLDDRREGHGDGEVLPGRAAAYLDPGVQHGARFRALRQSRDLHAHQGDRAPVERAATRRHPVVSTFR